MKGKVFLERALSKLGIASRTQAREWILAGLVQVNGDTIKDSRHLVSPEKDLFSLKNTRLKKAEEFLIMLHKPKRYITTKQDEKGRQTVYDLLPNELHHLHPVGRLDMHTTGLLLLSSNTRLSSYLTSLSAQIERVYLVLVGGLMTEEKKVLCLKGIEDDGEILRATAIKIKKTSGKESLLLVTLTEGKNREIRRLFQAIGFRVLCLKRISFGPWHLEDLPIGKWREVKPELIVMQKIR